MNTPLSEFTEGQWWIMELDAMAERITTTPEQKRAIAMVHQLLQAVAVAAAQPVQGDAT